MLLRNQDNNEFNIFQIIFLCFFIALFIIALKVNVYIFLNKQVPSFIIQKSEKSSEINLYHKLQPIQLKIKNVKPNYLIFHFTEKYYLTGIISGLWSYNTTRNISSDVESNVALFYDFDISSFSTSHNISIYNFKNIFYLIFGGIYSNNSLYSPHPSCMYDTSFYQSNYSTSFLVYQYNSVVGIFKEKMNSDRDFIYLFLPQLVSLPIYILYSSIFPFYGISRTMLSYFNIIGLKRDQIILEKDGLFAKNLFTISPINCDYGEPQLIFFFARKCVKD